MGILRLGWVDERDILPDPLQGPELGVMVIDEDEDEEDGWMLRCFRSDSAIGPGDAVRSTSSRLVTVMSSLLRPPAAVLGSLIPSPKPISSPGPLAPRSEERSETDPDARADAPRLAPLAFGVAGSALAVLAVAAGEAGTVSRLGVVFPLCPVPDVDVLRLEGVK